MIAVLLLSLLSQAAVAEPAGPVVEPTAPIASVEPVEPVEPRTDATPLVPTPKAPAPPIDVPGPEADLPDESFGRSALAIGSAAGCTLAGCIPGLLGVGGVVGTIAISLNSSSGLLQIFFALAQAVGVVVTLPMIGLFGVVSAFGAGCGGAVAGIFTGQDIWTIVLWSLPGAILGLLSGVVAGAGLLLLVNEDPRYRTIKGAAIPVTIAGTVLSSLAGPLTIGLITLTAKPAEPEDAKLDDVDSNTAKPVRWSSAPRGRMRF